MQSLRDAGIVLVVILLLVSVRLSPLDETDQAAGIAPLNNAGQASATVIPAIARRTQERRRERCRSCAERRSKDSNCLL